MATDIQFFDVSEFEVASWSPGAEGEDDPPTQVHILYRVRGAELSFILRLKSREATDSLIDALIEHRDFVWGDGREARSKQGLR